MYILQCGDYEPIISWDPSGKSLIIKNTQVFVDTVLSTFFKQTKFDSFTRKMRRWGFSTKRTRTPKAVSWVFEHPDFSKVDSFATCNRIMTSGSQKALDDLRMNNEDSTTYGLPAADERHNMAQYSQHFTPSASGPHSQTSQVVEGQQASSELSIVLAYRRQQRILSHLMMVPSEEQRWAALLSQGAASIMPSLTNATSARPSIRSEVSSSNIINFNMADAYNVDNGSARVINCADHSAASHWIGRQSDPCQRGFSFSAESTYSGGVDQARNQSRERMATPSSPASNHDASLLGIVANHAARRQRHQELVLGVLTSFSCQGQGCTDEEREV